MKRFFFFIFTLMYSCVFANHEIIDLRAFEQSVYSQNGEDGVLEKIFELISPPSKYCVEFGGYDGITGSNTFFFREKGWERLLWDGSYEIPEYNLYKEFVTKENINKLFFKYGVPLELGLLSIDIDFNDFYVWQALDPKYRPAVVVIEYNATHLPFEDKVVEYSPYFISEGTNYFGASILAFYNLGKSKGYTLVYAESRGVNLFFVRDDLLKEKNVVFKDMGDVQKIYRYPTYGTGPRGGHLQDPWDRRYVSSEKLLAD